MRGRVLQIAIQVSSTEWETIAQATSHKLTVSNQVSDVSTKDIGKVKEITGRSWSMSTDNLICCGGHTASGKHGGDLLKDYVKTGSTFGVRLQYAEITSTDSTDENEGNNSATTILTGTCRITSMQLNFPNKENSSYTAEFAGYGAITIPD